MRALDAAGGLLPFHAEPQRPAQPGGRGGRRAGECGGSQGGAQGPEPRGTPRRVCLPRSRRSRTASARRRSGPCGRPWACATRCCPISTRCSTRPTPGARPWPGPSSSSECRRRGGAADGRWPRAPQGRAVPWGPEREQGDEAKTWALPTGYPLHPQFLSLRFQLRGSGRSKSGKIWAEECSVWPRCTRW